MHIYFYDDNMRYIGCRLLNEDEEIPNNATSESVEVGDGKKAYLVDGKWEVSDILQESIITEAVTQ